MNITQKFDGDMYVSLAPNRWEILEDVQGNSVLPVASADEIYLERLLKRYGITPSWVESRQSAVRSFKSGATVALGRRWSKVAALYAHLTRRTYQCVETWNAMALDALEVLVLGADDLSEGRLDAIYAERSRSGTMPGILICTDERTAYWQVVSHLASRESLQDSMASILPNRTGVPEIDTEKFFLGGSWNAYLASSLRRLQSPIGAMVVETHSDGVDARLGESHILCTQVGENARYAATPYSPRCVETRFCHRLQQDLGEIRNSEQLVEPREMEATIVLWASCFGVVLPSDAAHRFEGSILDRFQGSAAFGALITTTGPALIRSRLIDFAVNMIRRGLTAGRLVAMLNASEPARAARLRFILIGEPLVKLPRSKRAPILRSRREPVFASDRNLGPDGGNLVFAISCVRALESRKSPAASRSGELSADEFISRLLQLYGSCGATLVEAWIHGWKPRAAAATNEMCPMCCGTSPLKRVDLLWMPGPRYGRTLGLCQTCGISVDRPDNWQGASVSYDGTSLSLAGPADDARVSMRSKRLQDSVALDWPRDSGGRLRRSFQPPALGFRGPLEIGVIIRHGRAVAIFSRRLRQGL